MLSQIKAEYLKLRYSNLFRVIPMLFALGLILYLVLGLNEGGTQIFVAEGDEEIDKTIQGVLGFFAFTFNNREFPQFSEILKSVLSCNSYLWIITIIFVVQFFNYDYSTGTIKLPIAYGISRVRIFFAKFAVMVSYYGVLYFLFTVVISIYTCAYISFIPSIEEVLIILWYTLLNFFVIITLIIISINVSILLKNTGFIATFLCIFTLLGAFIYTGTWQQFHSYTVIRYFVQLTPFYYMMNIGNLRLEYGIIRELFVYFFFGIIVLLPLAMLLVRKQEVK